MSPKRLSVFASLMRVTMVFLGALLSVRTLAFHGMSTTRKTQGMVPRGVCVISWTRLVVKGCAYTSLTSPNQ